ncbi:MAG: peptide ABC transporter substrate-binding protein [Candidatus Paceibacterota bacterium]
MNFLIKIYRNFSKKEKLLFIVSFLVFLLSSVIWTANFFLEKTVLAAVSGGEYVEGVVGQPSFINPILSVPGGVDSDINELIFSRLVDLSDSVKMSNNGRVWDIRLKADIFWDDKQPITSQDIDFTIKKIQNGDTQSPLESMWRGAQTEVISKLEIKISLSEPYFFFDETLKNLMIVPGNIFKGTTAANIKISDYNLEPTGNGPFKYQSFKKEKSGFISEYKFVRNEAYFGKKPYIDSVVFKFYKSEDELIDAFNSGEVNGFGGLSPKNVGKISLNSQIFNLMMPRYYAVFFNSYAQKNLASKNVRMALDYATDKKKITDEVFNGNAVVADGPIVLGMNGYDPKVSSESVFSLEKAAGVLDNDGWKIGEDGVRQKTVKKETFRLEFNLVSPDVQFLKDTANIIASDWTKIGVKLNVLTKSSEETDEIIKTRNYEMIIFGNSFTSYTNPDLSSFWYSSQKFYPGLNLSLYENKTVDNLIEISRETLNDSKRQSSLSSLQSLIVGDQPAVFLFSPDYIYVSKPQLEGFEEDEINSASDRFKNIENWYIKTARVFK